MTPMQELCAMRDERDTAICERDEALAKLTRAEGVAHWSEQAMIEANDRCAELRESAKSARWNAVYGATVIAYVNDEYISDDDMLEIVRRAKRRADQAEEAWEAWEERKEQ